jgi:hypothetical protein
MGHWLRNELCWSYGILNPDSAVTVDRKREAQPFRSEVDGFLSLSMHRLAVLRGTVKPHNNGVRKSKMTLRLQNRTPSLLQGFTSLAARRVDCRNQVEWKLEAASGFEPLHRGFADLSLNHLGTPPSAG